MNMRFCARLLVTLTAAILPACAFFPPLIPITPTPTYTPVPTETPSHTHTPAPLTETPVPTPARPAEPGNFKVKATCQKISGTSRNNAYVYHVTIQLAWEDRSDNEFGFDIFKNRVFFKTVDENVTEAFDAADNSHPISDSILYSIQSFNLEGKSARVDAKVTYVCQ